MRLKRLFKGQNFKVYLMELFIVILGISIAYQLNLYNEARINHKLELNVIKNLEKEIQINIGEFESLKAYRKRITDHSSKLLRVLKSKPISRDSAKKYILSLVQTSTPDLQRQATNSYLSSNYGQTNILLKNEILTLEVYFQELMELSDGYKKRKQDDFMSFLSESVDFSERRIASMEKIKTLEFKNIIWNIATDERELNRLYELSFSQLAKVDSIITQIIKEEE